MNARLPEDSLPSFPGHADPPSVSGRPGHEYILSPMQQGLLFHTLYDGAPGVYIQQMVCSLHEELDVPAFVRAWGRLLSRHSVLRSSLRWEDPREPGQAVERRADIPVAHHDWRDMQPKLQEIRLQRLLEIDRRRGFDLHQPPLMRLTLIRRADADWTCLWTYHHVLVDGRAHRLV
ncbi:MAG TPA: condensation domain-containing protein, partial [Gemmataceae bacterium]|nr:condensation domain-containing protein [Gemmataceae bacterium]